MTEKEHRRARWQLRRDFQRLIDEILTTIAYKIDTAHLRRLQGRAWDGGGRVATKEYWDFYKVYWRRWG